MKFHINKKILDDSIEIVSKYVDPISTFYSFRGIMIIVDNEFITLKAANDATSIVKKLPVDDVLIKVEQTGEFLIQANIFKTIIKKLSGEITIQQTPNALLEIIEGNSRYQLSTLQSNQFPVIDNLINTKQFELDTNEFKKAIKNVIHASSADNNLIYRCINMRYKNNCINFTATDSYRLALYQMKTNTPLEENIDISVNAKDLKDLIPSDAPKKITFFYNDIKVGIKYDNTIIISRIVSVPFRDTEPILADMNIKYNLQISKAELNELLNKVWLSNGDKQNRIEVSLTNNNLTLINNIAEIGSSVAKTQNFKFEGKTVEFDLNFNFLKDAISVFEDDISILIDDQVKKILILSPSNVSSKQLITPLRR
ncbi:DNA polymerase III subunit beta [Mycoplasma zalophidermidis]|uniref:DNA polymerase III subunit beta n=1 Tax=Mycoplasma zalophidermidis TaxID=398174 RepID=UPI001C0FD2B2|nr:DNA polymerase III subunit beta [Mycoplasma zalophidermidis]MBU4689591.1 DNA polymerase III subunit beta [Mycoplasma zalophidermidis]MCR8966551.1 DNA polymerase III subunit beta [Mycoplasma zalophidermidis]